MPTHDNLSYQLEAKTMLLFPQRKLPGQTVSTSVFSSLCPCKGPHTKISFFSDCFICFPVQFSSTLSAGWITNIHQLIITTRVTVLKKNPTTCSKPNQAQFKLIAKATKQKNNTWYFHNKSKITLCLTKQQASAPTSL